MTTYGAGWISGGGGPPAFAAGAERARAAWGASKRDGKPRLAALAYYALGDDASEHATSYLTDYYAFAGQYAKQIASAALTSEGAIRDAMRAFDEAGCDELILFPCNPDLGQIELLAGVVG